MKTTYKLISVALVIVCCLALFTSCQDSASKTLTKAGYSVPTGETKTADEFKAILDDFGYTVSDDTKTFTEQLGYSLEAYISAYDENVLYEFIICESEDDAKDVYLKKVTDMDSKSTPDWVTVSAGNDNFNKDVYDGDDSITCITRTKNTILLAVAQSEYKSDINNVFKELGY